MDGQSMDTKIRQEDGNEEKYCQSWGNKAFWNIASSYAFLMYSHHITIMIITMMIIILHFALQWSRPAVR